MYIIIDFLDSGINLNEIGNFIQFIKRMDALLDFTRKQAKQGMNVPCFLVNKITPNFFLDTQICIWISLCLASRRTRNSSYSLGSSSEKKSIRCTPLLYLSEEHKMTGQYLRNTEWQFLLMDQRDITPISGIFYRVPFCPTMLIICKLEFCHGVSNNCGV